MEPPFRPPEKDEAGNDDNEPGGDVPADSVTADYGVNEQTNELLGEIVEPKGPA
jgi:hypothetical protein